MKNGALLFKWLRRFSNNKKKCPLWKIVVCSNHGLDPNRGVVDHSSKTSGSL